jgi:hypothetical protein
MNVDSTGINAVKMKGFTLLVYKEGTIIARLLSIKVVTLISQQRWVYGISVERGFLSRYCAMLFQSQYRLLATFSKQNIWPRVSNTQGDLTLLLCIM